MVGCKKTGRIPPGRIFFFFRERAVTGRVVPYHTSLAPYIGMILMQAQAKEHAVGRMNLQVKKHDAVTVIPRLLNSSQTNKKHRD